MLRHSCGGIPFAANGALQRSGRNRCLHTNMDAIRGILLTLRTPRLWPYCVAPMLAAMLVYVLLGVAGFFLVVPHLPDWLGRFGIGGAWATGAEVVAVLLYLLLFPFFFTVIASGFIGLAFDPLSRAVEAVESGPDKGRLAAAPLTLGQTLGDSLARLALNGALGISALLLGLWLGPVPGVIAAATIGLLDYSSPAYLRRGHTLGSQWARLRRRLDGGALGFALVAGVLSLVPFVGLLLAPGLIAGGTLLTRRLEGELPQGPSS